MHEFKNNNNNVSRICKFHQEVECRAAVKVLEAPSNWSKNLKFHSNLCYLFKRYIKYTHKNRYVHKIIRQFHINITMCICPPLVNKYRWSAVPHVTHTFLKSCVSCDLISCTDLSTPKLLMKYTEPTGI